MHVAMQNFTVIIAWRLLTQHLCMCAFPYSLANRRLSEMTMELARAQETARRFQELLSTERRKQQGLRVSFYSGCTVKLE